MKLSKIILLAGSLVLGATQGFAADPGKTDAAQKVEWTVKMQELNQTLSELLTFVSSNELFENKKNDKKIESFLKDLASQSHGLKMKGSIEAHPDPAIRIFANELDSYAKEAYSTFKSGHREYARQVVRSITQACINCHSRTNSGPQFADLNPSLKKDLKGTDLASYLSATRQYDSSIAEYRKVVQSADALEKNIWEWEEALKQGLMLSVRVKKDPKLALAFIEDALKHKDVPFFVKQYAQEWKISINQWQDEWKKKKPTTESELFNEGKKLITRAKRVQKHAMDHSGDVDYLLASSVIYDLLERAPKSKNASEALFMAGVSLESISPRVFDHLPRVFYEECIRRSPHSKIAQSCYTAYEQQTYFVFTGSAGMDLPQDVKTKLLQLWALAMPVKEAPKVQ